MARRSSAKAYYVGLCGCAVTYGLRIPVITLNRLMEVTGVESFAKCPVPNFQLTKKYIGLRELARLAKQDVKPAMYSDFQDLIGGSSSVTIAVWHRLLHSALHAYEGFELIRLLHTSCSGVDIGHIKPKPSYYMICVFLYLQLAGDQRVY